MEAHHRKQLLFPRFVQHLQNISFEFKQTKLIVQVPLPQEYTVLEDMIRVNKYLQISPYTVK